MEIKVQPILKFHGVDIPNVNVNLTRHFNNESDQPEVELEIMPKVFYPEGKQNEFTIIIDLKISSKDYFNIAIVAFGSFELNKPTNDLESKTFINTNAPAIMFPYVRSFLSTLTSNLGSGIIPIILPPHFFKGDLEEFKAETKS